MVGDISLATRTEVLCAIRNRYRCCTAYASPSLRWQQSALSSRGARPMGRVWRAACRSYPICGDGERFAQHTRGGPGGLAVGELDLIPSRECGARYWAGSSSSLARNCSHFVGSSRPATSPIRSFGFDQCHIAKLTKRWSPRLRTVTPSTPRCADSTSVLLCPRDNHTRGPNYPPSKYGTPLFHFVPPCSTSDTNRGTPTVPFFGKVFHRPDRNGTLWNTMEQLTR